VSRAQTTVGTIAPDRLTSVVRLSLIRWLSTVAFKTASGQHRNPGAPRSRTVHATRYAAHGTRYGGRTDEAQLNSPVEDVAWRDLPQLRRGGDGMVW
jgi:hypothetical protein